ncbi:MAG: hypothetical protein HZA46_10035 [Planctomycetales bacterium]|nr:hypothetical protein [Planctomycetales bacterium]
MPLESSTRRSGHSRSYSMRRVRGLVLLLGVVLIGMQYALNPDHWRWLTDGPLVQPPKVAMQSQVADPAAAPRTAADEEPLPTGVFRTAGSRPAGEQDASSVQPGVTTERDASSSLTAVRLPDDLFANVSESRIGIRQDERDAYFTVLAQARDLPLETLEHAARRDLGYVELFNDPESYRGEVIAVAGQLRRLMPVTAEDNSHGFETLYEGWLFTDDSGANPYRIVFSRLPEGLMTGERIRAFVRFSGYFFKRTGYQNKAGDLHAAPLLLGKSPHWEPPVAMEFGSTWTTLLLVVGLVAVLCIVLVVQMRRVTTSDQRFHRQRRQLERITSDSAAALQELDVIDPRDELRRLSEQAQAVESEGAPRLDS